MSNDRLENTQEISKILQQEQREIKRAGRGVFNRASRTGSCGRKGAGVVMPGDLCGKEYKKGGEVMSITVDSILESLKGSSVLKEVLMERLESEHKSYQMAIGRTLDDVTEIVRSNILEVCNVVSEQQAYISNLQGRVLQLESNLTELVGKLSNVLNLGDFKMASVEKSEQLEQVDEQKDNKVEQAVVNSLKKEKVEKVRSPLVKASKEELFQYILEVEKEVGSSNLTISKLMKRDRIFHTRCFSSSAKCKYWQRSDEMFQEYQEWKKDHYPQDLVETGVSAEAG